MLLLHCKSLCNAEAFANPPGTHDSAGNMQGGHDVGVHLALVMQA